MGLSLSSGLVNPVIGMKGEEPGSILLHSPCVKVICGGPNVGVVSPQEYCYLEVRYEMISFGV